MKRLVLMALLAACATTPAPPAEPPPAAGPTPAPGPGSASVPAPPIKLTAQRAFDDAVAAAEDAKKLGVWDWERLEKKWLLVLSADDNVAEAWHNLGVIAERRGKSGEAKDHYAKAVGIKPSLEAAAGNLAALQAQDGDAAGALKTYENVLREWPDDPDARAGIAELHRRRGDDASATTLAREALARDPKSAAALKVLMRIALAKKDADLASLLALRAQKVTPQDPEIFDVQGQIQEISGDEPAALMTYKKAVKASAEFLPSRVRLARIALAHKDYEGAAEQLGAVVQRVPKRAALHLDLGVAWRGAGQLEKAEASYKKALELDPKMADATFALAFLHHRFKDDPTTAIALYKDFLRQKAPPADHPSFALLKEAEELQRAQASLKEAEKAAAKAAEEEAKKNAQMAKAAADGQSDGSSAAPPPAAPPPAPPPPPAAPKAAPQKEEGEPE